MFRIRNVVLVLASSLATAAGAESNTLTGRPGFFTPTPDGNSSISRTLPESVKVIPDVAVKVIPDVGVTVIPDVATATTVRDPIRRKVIPDVAAATTVRDPILRVETPAATVAKVEPELDRAEREHRDMTERSARAATSLQGAFTGATSERDR